MAVCMGLFGAACGSALGAEPTTTAADEAAMWLNKLEERGRELRTFEANVFHQETNVLLRDQQARTGRVFYIAPDRNNGRPTRFAIHFRQFIADGAVHERPLEFIFDGVWLVEKDHDQRRFEKRQVVAPGQEGTIDPISIDGPFPLPLGQKREDVMRRFEVSVVHEENDPAEQVRLRLIPRIGGGDHRGDFDRADLWFDRETLLPVKVETDKGASVTEVRLSQIKVNEGDAAKWAQRFDTTPPRTGWRVEIKPWEE